MVKMERRDRWRKDKKKGAQKSLQEGERVWQDRGKN
jgi:hypothetical protein